MKNRITNNIQKNMEFQKVKVRLSKLNIKEILVMIIQKLMKKIKILNKIEEASIAKIMKMTPGFRLKKQTLFGKTSKNLKKMLINARKI